MKGGGSSSDMEKQGASPKMVVLKALYKIYVRILRLPNVQN